MERTLQSLAQQADARFRIRLHANESHVDIAGLLARYKQLEIVEAENILEPPERTNRIWIAELRPGDALAPEAVLALRGFIGEHPDADVVYTDHAFHPEHGKPVPPCLKPDWSPAFYEGIDYIDRLCLIRADHSGLTASAGPDEWRADLRRLLLSALSQKLSVEHLKRVLVTVRSAETPAIPDPKPANVAIRTNATATVVIPTRDRLDLLRTAVESLEANVQSNGLNVIIVDNGSTDADCLSYLNEVEKQERFLVLSRPGSFNFSHLVNAGAEHAKSDVLILLNNDCAVLDAGWLETLTALAIKPDVGAVGAKLLYDNGKIQHAGVGIGLGGEAGHRNRGRNADFPGYLNRLRFVHEVSAVTGACLAIERRKFHEIGGFDEAFAVAFNDIDFCLRLRAGGYRNLFTPHATLRHSESVSRGSDRRPGQRERWSREAALFRQRWQHVILDDPYMHPLLSLWRFQEILQ